MLKNVLIPDPLMTGRVWMCNILIIGVILTYHTYKGNLLSVSLAGGMGGKNYKLGQTCKKRLALGDRNSKKGQVSRSQNSGVRIRGRRENLRT